MRGRFLQSLEKSIESPCAQHVNLIDEVNFEWPARGRVGGVVAKVADIFDTIVARAVDLDHIEIASLGDLLANIAFAARL